MTNKIWQVTVTEKVLLFKEVEEPIDFSLEGLYEEYKDLSGIYLGLRQYGATEFYLRSDAKKPIDSQESVREWRLRTGNSNIEEEYPFYNGYAWSPQGFMQSKGILYATHINFL